MRVRTKRQRTESRRRGGSTFRPSVLVRDTPAAPPAEPEVAPEEDDDLADERRLRASGGPHDRAQYSCVCGFVWEDDVSASVSCPHCGTAQAW
jgi:hypothetical protein